MSERSTNADLAWQCDHYPNAFFNPLKIALLSTAGNAQTSRVQRSTFSRFRHNGGAAAALLKRAPELPWLQSKENVVVVQRRRG